MGSSPFPRQSTGTKPRPAPWRWWPASSQRSLVGCAKTSELVVRMIATTATSNPRDLARALGVLVPRQRRAPLDKPITQEEAERVTRVRYGVLGVADKGWRLATFAPLRHRFGLHLENGSGDSRTEIFRKLRV